VNTTTATETRAMQTKINAALKLARAPWGVGWSSLTDAHRHALVCSVLFSQMAALDIEDITVERRAAMMGEWIALSNLAMATEF
jgi:hypothetical protein